MKRLNDPALDTQHEDQQQTITDVRLMTRGNSEHCPEKRASVGQIHSPGTTAVHHDHHADRVAPTSLFLSHPHGPRGSCGRCTCFFFFVCFCGVGWFSGLLLLLCKDVAITILFDIWRYGVAEAHRGQVETRIGRGFSWSSSCILLYCFVSAYTLVLGLLHSWDSFF